MSVHEVVQHGWLVKSPPEAKDRLFGSLIKKQWKKRYFVLTYISPLKKTSLKMNQSRNSTTPSINSSLNLNTSTTDKKASSERHRIELSYYESEKMQKLQGSIDLMRCEEVLSHLQSPLFKHVFAIRTFHKSNRPRMYYLVTSSEAEMLTWVGHLTTYLRMISDNSRTRQVSQSAVSMTSLCKPQQRQPSSNNSHHPPTLTNHYSSPSHHSNLSYSTTINNHHSSSTNNLDPKFFQNGLPSTLNRKNPLSSNENSPSLPRAPFLKRMDSISQRSERPTSRLMDNSPHDSRNNSQYPLCPPQPDLHAFLPLLTNNNSTLPRSRVQCQAEERMGLYDRPVTQKTQHCFFDNINNLMKLHNNSIDRRKLPDPNGMVYDVPPNKQYDLPLHHNHYDLPPIPPADPREYDIPASLRTPCNNVVYDTPESAKISLLPTQPYFYNSVPESSAPYSPTAPVYSVPMKDYL